MSSSGQPYVSPAASVRIPPLSFSGIETGGGWGLGDQFARLPPGEEQQRDQVYKVAHSPIDATAAMATTEDDASPMHDPQAHRGAVPMASEIVLGSVPQHPPVAETFYKPQGDDDDDDNTFVDHGSAVQAAMGSQPTEHSVLDRKRPIFTSVPHQHVTIPADLSTSPRCEPPTLVKSQPAASGPLSTLPNTGGGASVASTPLHLSRAGVRGHHSQAAAKRAAGPAAGPVTSKTKGDAGPYSLPPQPHQPTQAPSSSTFSSSQRVAMRDPQRCNPPMLVSRMVMNVAMRDMVISPDGRSMWTAIGDDPVTLLELRGSTLDASHSIESVAQVHCLAMVRVPCARQTTFTSAPEGAVKAGARGRSKTDSKGREEAGDVDACAAAKDSYTLWCGMSRGNISIINLQTMSVENTIRHAHAQAVHKIWYLDNGKVWSSGRDKAIRIWDPQSHRKLKNRNIAATLTDLCYVSTAAEVWAIAGDNIIRVYGTSGDNVRIPKQSHDKAENAIKMKNEVTLISFCEDGNMVWAAMGKTTAVMDPETYEVGEQLNLTLTTIAFHNKTAIITGSGGLVQSESSCIAILDVTNPNEPSLLYKGITVEAVSPIGMRLFTAAPLAVIAHDEQCTRSNFISVFTYENSPALGWATTAKDVVSPQHKEIVHHNALSRTGTTPAPTAAATTASVATQAPSRSYSVTKSVPITEVQPIPNVSRAPGALHGRRSPVAPSGEHSLRRSASMQKPSAASQLQRQVQPSSSHASTQSLHSQQAARATEQHPSSSMRRAPSDVLSSIQQVDKQMREIKHTLSSWRRESVLMEDFAKVHNTLTRWMLDGDSESLPRLTAEESEAIDKEFATPEGKAVGIGMARLQKGFVAIQNGWGGDRVGARGAHQDGAAGPSRSVPLSRNDSSTGVPWIPPHCGNSPSADALPNAHAARRQTRAGITDTHTSEPGTGNSGGGGSAGDHTSEALINGVVGGNSEGLLLHWVSTLSRAGQDERRNYQRQVQSLDKHNRRIEQRSNALLYYIRRMEQVALQSCQQLLDECSNATHTGTSVAEVGEVYKHCEQRYREVRDVLQRLPRTSALSSVRDIKESTEALVDVVSTLTAAHGATMSAALKALSGVAERDPGSIRSLRGHQQQDAHPLGLVDPAYPCEGGGAGSLRHSTSVFDDTALNCTGVGGSAVPPAVPAALPPRRVLEMLCAELNQLEASVAQVDGAWSRVEDMHRVVYETYRQGQAPDLGHDLMQYAVLWDVTTAQAMINLCRMEIKTVVLEALIGNREESYFTSIAVVDGGVSVLDELTGPPGSPGERTSSLSSRFCSEAERVATVSRAAVESPRVVSVSLDLDTAVTRVRASLERLISPNAEGEVSDGAGSCSTGLICGMMAMKRPPRVRESRLRGMLHWTCVSVQLLVECAEAVTAVLYPPSPIRIGKDNFFLFSTTIGDWQKSLAQAIILTNDVHAMITTVQREMPGLLHPAGTYPSVSSGSIGKEGSPPFTNSRDSIRPRRSLSRSTSLADLMASGGWSSSLGESGPSLSGGTRGRQPLRSVQTISTELQILFQLYMAQVFSQRTRPLLFLSGDDASSGSDVEAFDLHTCLDDMLLCVHKLRRRAICLDEYFEQLNRRVLSLIERNSHTDGAQGVAVSPASANFDALRELRAEDY